MFEKWPCGWKSLNIMECALHPNNWPITVAFQARICRRVGVEILESYSEPKATVQLRSEIFLCDDLIWADVQNVQKGWLPQNDWFMWLMMAAKRNWFFSAKVICISVTVSYSKRHKADTRNWARWIPAWDT